jgi:hypothetical protein
MSLVQVYEIGEERLSAEMLGLNTLVRMCLSAIWPQILNLQLYNHSSFQNNKLTT